MRRIYTCPVPFTWCPTCGKVLKAANRLGVEYERRKVWQFPRDRRTEVIDLSGQNLVPIIVEDDGFVLHESDDIVAYIEEKIRPRRRYTVTDPYAQLIGSIEKFEQAVTSTYERLRDRQDDAKLREVLDIMARESARHARTIRSEVADRIPDDPFANLEPLRQKLQREAVHRVSESSSVTELLESGAAVEEAAADVYQELSRRLKAQVARYDEMAEFFMQLVEDEHRHKSLFLDLLEGHRPEAAESEASDAAPEAKPANESTAESDPDTAETESTE